MEILEKTITDLSGFKISNSHFRIGSKIHISDFYYAKRFFQNGFFSSRIAFLLANDIIKFIEAENKKDEIKKNGLTIIGYEMYSELLISLVDKFLRKKWNLNESKINHNLYEDAENLRLCKKNNILPNVVIIVPIASTFSTSIKIENQILQDTKGNKNGLSIILKPHLNVLYVSDGTPTDIITEVEKGFSWKKKNIADKSITVEAIYSEENEIDRTQKYYLTLPTVWHNVEDCELCNPTRKDGDQVIENLDAELPLYETDRTAVTPAIIFDYPKGRFISKDDLKRKIIFDNETVIYGHHVRGNGHFLYSVDTELFLERNKQEVQDWLMEIKNSEAFKNSYKETDRVIIISSCHFSNTAFITLVNDYLFSSSANIIHYDPSNDYVQNFKIVYGQEMNDADKIFFVDDSLKSGSTFDKIYQFIQHTLDFSSDNKDKGITGCFFLLNKSQPYTFNNLQNKLVDAKHIFAFANLHLYTSLNHYETSPLEIEEKRYRELMSNSFIDSLKVHFQKQENKLSLKWSNPKEPVIGFKADRHLKMLIATHRIYQYFTVVRNPILNSFYDFINDLNSKTESPIEKTNPNPLPIENLKQDEPKAYLKVLTQSPFTQYKPLKDQVFKWTLQLLIIHLNEVDAAISKNNFTYQLFDTLKFLIRRAGLLNSNILISKTLIEFLPKLYSPNGIPKLITQIELSVEELKLSVEELKFSVAKVKTTITTTLFTPNSETLEKEIKELKEEINKLKDFHIFYVAQIKELLLWSESRCIRLEKILELIKADKNLFIKQIVRILREENSVIIKKFAEHITNQNEWDNLKIITHNGDEKDDEVEFDNKQFISLLENESISKHHKYQTLNLFLDEINQSRIDKNLGLINLLWLEYFMSYTEKYEKPIKITLSYRTNLIFKKLLQTISEFSTISPGGFFIVNDSQENPFVAFNSNYNGESEIDGDKLKSDDNNYLNKFFKGEDNSNKKEPHFKHSKTLIELKRNSDGKWIDLFSTSLNPEISDLSQDFIPNEYNRIVLVRLNKRSNEKLNDKTQGIIGFYYKVKSEEIIDISIFRYLLLLRPLLSQFIEKHHENDEFRDWQIAEIKQKTSLLTGHGREMLQNVARNKGGHYYKIVSNLVIIQRLLIDKKEVSDNIIYRTGRFKKIFEAYYPTIEDAIKIDNTFFSQVETMAKEIFEFEEIENTDQLEHVVQIVPGNLSFRFQKEILRMICFELLVNAKKNRWLFSGQTINDNDGNSVTANKVWIEAKLEQDKLVVVISSTGPEISNDDLKKINRKKNIKRYDNSSGIELIDTILTEFELGKISFTQTAIAEKFSKFSATLTLNQNPNGD